MYLQPAWKDTAVGGMDLAPLPCACTSMSGVDDDGPTLTVTTISFYYGIKCSFGFYFHCTIINFDVNITVKTSTNTTTNIHKTSTGSNGSDRPVGSPSSMAHWTNSSRQSCWTLLYHSFEIWLADGRRTMEQLLAVPCH
mmetsp:Transcript_3860/g.10744  ORF Transcript_3860/g.10744 Transcript_3860/m.10744 type:complete len:139 (+) Transcript_3860:223-639(+)